MVNRTRKWEKIHNPVYVDDETFAEIDKIRIRDESNNSVIGYLIEFYKAHKDDFEITKDVI